MHQYIKGEIASLRYEFFQIIRVVTVLTRSAVHHGLMTMKLADLQGRQFSGTGFENLELFAARTVSAFRLELDSRRLIKKVPRCNFLDQPINVALQTFD